MKILGIWRNVSWCNNNILPALKRLGDLHVITVPVAHSANSLIYTHQKVKFGNDIIACIKKVKPDLIFCYLRNRWIMPFTIQDMRKFKILMINLSLDDSHKLSLVLNLAPYFDLNLTTTKSAIYKYNMAGANVLYFPGGVDPDTFRLNDVKKDIDVCFVGRKYGNRARAKKLLSESGINTVFRGKGWAQGPVSFEEMIDLYSRSRIVLGFSRTCSNSKIFNLKGRDLEVTGSGSFYLCEQNPELAEWFRDGKDLIFWNNLDDLIAKAKLYLADGFLRNDIANSGYKKTVNNYTWSKLFENILERSSDGRFKISTWCGKERNDLAC